ncbi:MAG TPA: non-canonical purine NTP pyrophosphatase, partial [Chitinophagaceae bacterium]
GGSGFGYDPVFVPDGASKTFAEMELEEKNRFSHRAKAFFQLISWLRREL